MATMSQLAAVANAMAAAVDSERRDTGGAFMMNFVSILYQFCINSASILYQF